MSSIKYILRSLWFYRRHHLALFIGTVISTAVLTGALIVGDSVKFSLKKLVDLRLGNTDYVLQTGTRFVRAGLADDLRERLGDGVISLNIVNGIGVNPDSELQVNHLQIVAIGDDFDDFFGIRTPEIGRDEVLVSRNLASRLMLEAGSSMILRAEDVSVIPLNAPFSQDAQGSVGLRVTVKGILGDDQMARFSLKNNQAAPMNVFIDRDYLGEKLGIPGLANTLLVSETDKRVTAPQLDSLLNVTWQVEDFGVHVQDLNESNKYEILSDRIFIDNQVSDAVLEMGFDTEKMLTYLVNAIRLHDLKTPYSFVTAATPPYVESGADDSGIIINDWLANDLSAVAGDTLTLDYFVVGPLRKLKEKSQSFRVSKIIETGAGLIDSTLMPAYPGLSEANNCRDWDTGIPIDLGEIRDKDEFYWDDYKGTPKALISFTAGKSLWSNEFGRHTALRISMDDTGKEELEQKLAAAVDPSALDLVFKPARAQGINAAENSVDFGELFLSLSFFVIAAGLLLTILLYGLQSQSRMAEAGVLSALGFNRTRIMFIRFLESSLIALLASGVGALFGIWYNQGIMLGLNSVWQGAVRSDMLDVYIFNKTILIGALSGFMLGGVSIFVVTYLKLRRPVTGILKNDSMLEGKVPLRRNRLFGILGAGALLGSVILIVYAIVKGLDQNADMFLSAGALFMLAGLAGFRGMLRRLGIQGKGTGQQLLRLSLKNASRNKARSISTVALLALGVFTIIITGANRKTYYGSENDRASGTGGFLFWAETTLPVIADLSMPAERDKFGISGEDWMTGADFLQFMALSGDDASCLNLNQVQQPRILGIEPVNFDARSAFSFARLLDGVDRKDPWLELGRDYPEGVIPAFADQTVITWGLMKKLGDTLYYTNEKGETIKLLLAGGFSNSIFQGNILIDQKYFHEHFPSVSGSNVMLVDASTDHAENIAALLQSQLQDYGIELTRASVRLAEFNTVENTYLTVFMLLGGLGVIIGTVGLGIVMYRNLLDRKGELALLAALGFNRTSLLVLILAENLMLLVSGLVLGIAGAFIGILPSVLSPAYTIPGNFMVWLVAGVFLSGLAWIILPAAKMMKYPLVSALRNE